MRTWASMKGFTLLEVMVALAIVAIALTALLSLGIRSINAQNEIQKITRATMLGERTMSEVEILYAQGREGELMLGGVYEEPFEDYRWEITYSGTILPAVQQVDVNVLWGSGERIENIEITSFVFRSGESLLP